MKPGKNLFEEELTLSVEFPLTITREMVDKLIKRNSSNFNAMLAMYV